MGGRPTRHDLTEDALDHRRSLTTTHPITSLPSRTQAQPVRLSTSCRRGVGTRSAGRWNSAPEGCGAGRRHRRRRPWCQPSPAARRRGPGRRRPDPRWPCGRTGRLGPLLLVYSSGLAQRLMAMAAAGVGAHARVRGPLVDQEPPLPDHHGRPTAGPGRLRQAPPGPRRHPPGCLGPPRGRLGGDRRRLLGLRRLGLRDRGGALARPVGGRSGS
jgi:hypothetical protein